MRNRDMRKVVLILYVLTLLLLGIIYVQGSLLADPGAIATLQNAAQSANSAGGYYANPLVDIQISGDSLWAVVGVVTAFFGFVWRIVRTRPYEA
ncbi:MAG: hypothetical protein R3C41_17465 [Calditrichia bacterium]|nr:hypothetical protein [Calditrichota bacterium]MCB0269754.1 hypothetical protein [Calditrichota bacterium]MCB9070653.1 hypothetical protein [Calditrichia bacterium]